MRRPAGLVPRATRTVARAAPPLRKAFEMVTQTVDRRIGWDRLPKLPGLVVLVGLRNVLRRENLHDTGAAPFRDAPPVAPFEPRFRAERTADGTHNDLAEPAMGMAGSRFGRNVPPERTHPADVLSPNPRTVSRRLLTRTEFVPATTVNNLAAAWLQFMIRDWFSHGRNEADDPWSI